MTTPPPQAGLSEQEWQACERWTHAAGTNPLTEALTFKLIEGYRALQAQVTALVSQVDVAQQERFVLEQKVAELEAKNTITWLEVGEKFEAGPDSIIVNKQAFLEQTAQAQNWSETALLLRQELITAKALLVLAWDELNVGPLTQQIANHICPLGRITDADLTQARKVVEGL